MKNKETITLQSKWLTIVTIIITALYVNYLFFNINTIVNDLVSFLPYSFVFILLFFGFWSSTVKVQINKDKICVSTIFSFNSPKTYQMKDVSRIILRVDYFKRVIKVLIEFNNGQQIQLHDYQENFVAAREFLIEKLKNVTVETQFGIINKNT